MLLSPFLLATPPGFEVNLAHRGLIDNRFLLDDLHLPRQISQRSCTIYLVLPSRTRVVDLHELSHAAHVSWVGSVLLRMQVPSNNGR